jgi:hypothetical protein
MRTNTGGQRLIVGLVSARTKPYQEKHIIKSGLIQTACMSFYNDTRERKLPKRSTEEGTLDDY